MVSCEDYSSTKSDEPITVRGTVTYCYCNRPTPGHTASSRTPITELTLVTRPLRAEIDHHYAGSTSALGSTSYNLRGFLPGNRRSSQ